VAKGPNQKKAQAAWDRIEALGGSGVWESDIVMVSLANTAVTDDDLALFRDFPFVQSLDLSHTKVTGAGLSHLEGASDLEELAILGTKISRAALAAFREAHPNVEVVTKPPKKGSVNPFTGEPL
jgi:hypothetical protein